MGGRRVVLLSPKQIIYRGSRSHSVLEPSEVIKGTADLTRGLVNMWADRCEE